MNTNQILINTFHNGNPDGYMDAIARSEWRRTKKFKDTNMLTTRVLNGVGPYRAGVLKDLAQKSGRYPTWGEWVAAYAPMLTSADIERAVGKLVSEGLSEGLSRRLAIIRLIDEPFLGSAREGKAVEFLRESLGTAWNVRGAFLEEDTKLKLDIVCSPFDSVCPHNMGVQVKALSFAYSPRIAKKRLQYREWLTNAAQEMEKQWDFPAKTGILFYEGDNLNDLRWYWAETTDITEERMNPKQLVMPYISEQMGLYNKDWKGA